MKFKFLLLFLLLWTIVDGQTNVNFSEPPRTALDSVIHKAYNFININIDSALYYARFAEKQYEKGDAVDAIAVFSCLGATFSAKGNMDQALEYYLRAKRLNDSALNETPNDVQVLLGHTNLLMRIGALKFNLNQFDQSLIDFQSALNTLENLQDKIPDEELALKKAGIYNNIAGVYIQLKDYDTALTYFQNGLKLIEKLNNQAYESSVTNNLGICYLEKREYDLADHYFLRALAIRTKIGDKRGQAQCLNNLAKNQVYQGNFKKAEEHFEKALGLGKEVGHVQSMLISLESLCTVYDTLSLHKKALRAYKEFKSLNDSIFNHTSATNMARLEADYRHDKEEKVAQLEIERNRAETQRAETRNLAILGASFFVLLTAGLLLLVMRGRVVRSKLEQEKLRLESVNSELERRTLVETIQFKERELTANALFLLKNNELLASISEKLLNAKSTFRQENQQIIQDVIFELSANQNQNVWEEFEAHFIRVHADFYQKLQEHFPNLSPNEMKLCAFLRLNMSTKEISAITHQTVNSITVARSRLRKKLNLDGEDTQLVNFLMQL